MRTSAEQEARDMLERMGIEDAQSFSSGDVVELSNLIAAVRGFTWDDVDLLRACAHQWEVEHDAPDGAWYMDPGAYENYTRAESLADRIAALLPPRQS